MLGSAGQLYPVQKTSLNLPCIQQRKDPPTPNPGGSPARKEIAILGNIHNNR